MTGSCWRLLAVLLLIFAVVTPASVRGQDATARGVVVPAATLAADPASRLDASPLAPVWIPPPSLPVPYPVGRHPVVRNPGVRNPGVPGSVVFRQFAFRQLVRAAGIIFSGQVTSIGTADSSSGQPTASTAVTFLVEHAIRGASLGQNLTIHEWAGLWNNGERYRVGDRVLLFLYAPGKLGLTSPVAGAMGRFAMDSQSADRDSRDSRSQALPQILSWAEKLWCLLTILRWP